MNLERGSLDDMRRTGMGQEMGDPILFSAHTEGGGGGRGRGIREGDRDRDILKIKIYLKNKNNKTS